MNNKCRVSDELVDKVCKLHLTEIFEEVVNKNKGKNAIECKNESLTFEELHEKSNQVANFLIEKQLKENSMVSLCMERSIDMIVWILGILKSGGIYVPMVTSYPRKRIEVILSETKCEFAVISSPSSLGLFNDLQLKGLFVSDQILEGIIKKFPTKISKNVDLKPESTSCCFFTSGSTGLPKGIVVTSKNISHNALLGYEHLGLTENDKYGGYSSIIFTVSLIDLFTPLLNGITLVMFPEECRRDPISIKEYVNKHKITCLHSTPVILKHFPRTPFTHQVTFLRVGGESCDYETMKYWASQAKMLLSAYGLTESSGGATMKPWEPEDESTNIGKPWGTYKVHIMDDHMQPITTPGVTGEVFIEGLGITKGYFNLPQQNRETFLKNPYFDPNDPKSSPTILKTGDFCKYSEKFDVCFIGRIDHQTKIRGNRINVLEIESVIRKVQGVQNVIVGVKRTEQGSKRLVAYIILEKNEKEEEKEEEKEKYFAKTIRTHVEKVLPDFMVPNNYVFMEKYPKTVSGKIDRITLSKDTPLSKDFSSKDHQEARNETERVLVDIWKEVLNIEEEEEDEKKNKKKKKITSNTKIGIFDGFYELGGNSLLLTLLVRKVNDNFKKSFSPLSFLRDGVIDISRISSLVYDDNKKNIEEQQQQQQKEEEEEEEYEKEKKKTTSTSSYLLQMIRSFRKHETFIDWNCEPPIKYYVLSPSTIVSTDESSIASQLEEIAVLNTNTYLGLEGCPGNPIRVHLKMSSTCRKEWHEHNKNVLISSYEEGTLVVAKTVKTGQLLGHYSNCNFEGCYSFEELPWEMKVEKKLYDLMKKNAQLIPSNNNNNSYKEPIFEDSVAVIPNNHPSVSFFLGVLGNVIARKRGFRTSYFTPTAPTTQKRAESYDRKYYRSHKPVFFDQFEVEEKEGSGKMIKVFLGIKETYLGSIEKKMKSPLPKREKQLLTYTYVNSWTKSMEDHSMEEILGLI